MFRFTIRDLLWLMVVAGLACGWWLDHRHMTDELFELKVRAFFSSPQDTDL